MPIRFPADAADAAGAAGAAGAGARRRLPLVDACPKNFTRRSLEGIDADCVLDQATLSTLLAALDAAHADARGRPRGERFDLAELLAAAARSG